MHRHLVLRVAKDLCRLEDFRVWRTLILGGQIDLSGMRWTEDNKNKPGIVAQRGSFKAQIDSLKEFFFLPFYLFIFSPGWCIFPPRCNNTRYGSILSRIILSPLLGGIQLFTSRYCLCMYSGLWETTPCCISLACRQKSEIRQLNAILLHQEKNKKTKQQTVKEKRGVGGIWIAALQRNVKAARPG